MSRNEKLFSTLSDPNTKKWSAGVAFNRSNPLPLDYWSVFESKDYAEEYLNNPRAYPGQIIAYAKDNGEMAVCVISQNPNNTNELKLKSINDDFINVMNFLGATDDEIADGKTTTISKPTGIIEATYTPKAGDVVIDSKGQECVFDGAVWRHIGDASYAASAGTADYADEADKANSADTATMADKLNLDGQVGANNQPVYFNGEGVPIAINYTIKTNVPENAVFTDTTYSTFSTTKDGLVPKPTSNNTTKFLRGDGTWATPEAGGSTTGVGQITPEGGEIFSDYENNYAMQYGTAQGQNTGAGIKGYYWFWDTAADRINGVLSISTDYNSINSVLPEAWEKNNGLIIKSTKNIPQNGIDYYIENIYQENNVYKIKLSTTDEWGEIINFVAGMFPDVSLQTLSQEQVIWNINNLKAGINIFPNCFASHSEGNVTAAIGKYSHAEGHHTIAGNYSHAEGYRNYAAANASHAEGRYSIAKGDMSHAEGYTTSANGKGSHAEGSWTKAKGDVSHTEGANTETHGQGSHAEGYGTIAASDFQHVAGKYNIIDGEYDNENKIYIGNQTYAQIIGNGNDNENRSNAHTVNWDGTGWFKNTVMIGGENQFDEDAKCLATEDYVDTKIAEIDPSKIEYITGKSSGYLYIYNIETRETTTETITWYYRKLTKDESFDIYTSFSKTLEKFKSLATSVTGSKEIFQLSLPFPTKYASQGSRANFSINFYAGNENYEGEESLNLNATTDVSEDVPTVLESNTDAITHTGPSSYRWYTPTFRAIRYGGGSYSTTTQITIHGTGFYSTNGK